MCAERVVFDNAAPVCVYHALAVFFWPDAVLPVVFVCKAAARPAQVRNVNVLECLYYGLVVSVYVWNLRVFAYTEAAVDTAAQMLGKMPVYVGADGLLFVLCVDNNLLFHITSFVKKSISRYLLIYNKNI